MNAILDKSRFDSLLVRLGGNKIASQAFHRLLAAYSEAQRHYHTSAHIADCLAQFDLFCDKADRPDEVEAALWFHDVVYDPRAHDNEQRSAEWVGEEFREAGISVDVANRMAALVLLTRHNAEPDSRDGALLVDVDLSILGRDPDRFATYDSQIRREHEWVPEATYRTARAEVLTDFLRRPFLYRTEVFRDQYEAQARCNLEQLIRRLQSGSNFQEG